VLIDSLLKDSGSRRELSPALRVVLPFRARSRLEGVLWRMSSSSSKACLEVGVWGSGVYGDIVAWIHCKQEYVCNHR